MSERLRPIRAREVVAALIRDGWYEVHGKGGHRQFKHTRKPGKVTVPVHQSQDIGPRLLRRIITQTGLSIEEFRRLLKGG